MASLLMIERVARICAERSIGFADLISGTRKRER